MYIYIIINITLYIRSIRAARVHYFARVWSYRSFILMWRISSKPFYIRFNIVPGSLPRDYEKKYVARN